MQWAQVGVRVGGLVDSRLIGEEPLDLQWVLSTGQRSGAPLDWQWGSPLEPRRGAPLEQQWGSPLDLGLVWESSQVWVLQVGGIHSFGLTNPWCVPRKVADICLRRCISICQIVL